MWTGCIFIKYRMFQKFHKLLSNLKSIFNNKISIFNHRTKNFCYQFCWTVRNSKIIWGGSSLPYIARTYIAIVTIVSAVNTYIYQTEITCEIYTNATFKNRILVARRQKTKANVMLHIYRKFIIIFRDHISIAYEAAFDHIIQNTEN